MKLIPLWLLGVSLIILGLLTPFALAAEFAGEELPLNRAEAAEGVDQELLLLSEAKSRVWLTLRRSARYLPLIDAALTKEKVPLDFRYLPMALTSLSSTYQANGRAGLWRFNLSDAKALGLKVTPELDERLDPVTSSLAASQKIAALLKTHGSPILALAAFIDQPSVEAALLAAGGKKDFFSLYLPEILEKNVYQVLAGRILFSSPATYGYQTNRTWPILAKSRQKLTQPLDLKDEAAKLKLDYKTFRDLNPHVLGDVAPVEAFIYRP
jgi:hypothetical protein